MFMEAKKPTFEQKQKAYELEALQIIESKNILRYEHLFSFTSFSKSTARNYNLNESTTIKEAIEKNRVGAVTYMLDKWLHSDNATLQIALMRLICTPEMHKRLNQNYVTSETEHKLSPELQKQLEEAQKRIKV